MNIGTIRDMTNAQIDQTIEEVREEKLRLRIQREMGTLQDLARLSELKRDLARLLTVRRERQLAAELVNEKENAAYA